MLHRKNENVELKRELVRTAACLVNDGDTIIVDSGSTANEFILTLCSGFRALSVITHSMTVFEALHNAPGIRIILIGGEYLKSEECFFGAIALECLHQLHATTSFIFPSAISLKYGVADYSSELIPIQKKYLEISNHTVILADSSKFEKTALMKICSTDNSHIYVTDSMLDDNIYKLYRENGIRVYRNKEEIHNESKSIANIG